MTATGIGALVEESTPGREMESIGDTSVPRRRAPAGVGERVKEGEWSHGCEHVKEEGSVRQE